MSEEKMEIIEYSESGFWEKIAKYAKSIGKELLEKVLQLYYALGSENCTTKDRGIILGALAYVISPIDIIPDLTPIIGYTDDMGVVAAALVAVAKCIDVTVKSKAADKLKEWFN